ncbi:FtsB family cell division protein [Ichthyenterobacterium magnum]|uniref:Cell division protein FtsL n=1 Tax=Ichthyenterobacterium magnum TaxID=1230530 RepID=A0A420DGT5_9FLAO|nr:septum formation initiator family protein [Ichthyenterobacterium magnum]RKE92290.1 cell division protein FtsL [Ichthyenterobacterium magnum]
MPKSKTKYLKPFKNLFVIILIVFAVWMLFFDANSWLIHHELNTDIEDLENEKDYYKKEIKKDKKEIKELSTNDGIEKLAREKYYMKKDNEDIYIIEYQDSIPKKKEDE